MENRYSWHDITGDLRMKFHQLICNDGYEVYFDTYSGKRYMKYNNPGKENVHMKNNYKLLHEVFVHNTDICSQYLIHESKIRCKYMSASCNVLANYRGVREQYVHTDYKKE